MNAPTAGDFAAAAVTQLGPFDIELEQTLLGSILVANKALHECAHLVDAADFYDPLHRDLFYHISDLIKSGQVAEPSTLKPLFADYPDITPECSVAQYLGTLACAGGPLVNAATYAKKVREMAQRRNLISGVSMFCRNVVRNDLPLDDLILEHLSDINDILSKGETRNTVVPAHLAVKRYLEDLHSQEKVHSVATGNADVDRILGGYFRGEYVIVAGRPGMGKSAFATSTLLRTAMKGHGVLYFSAEMTASALTHRCISDLVWNSQTPIPYSGARQRQYSEHEKERLTAASKRLEECAFVIDELAAPTVMDIAMRARAQAARFRQQGKRLDIICVDHMGKMASSGRYSGSRVNEVMELSAGLAALAKDLDCTVVALSQLSRGVESMERKNKRPTLSDLRDSGSLEQDADVVMFVYRSAYYLERQKFDEEDKEQGRLERLEREKNDMEIVIAKHRAGQTGTVKLMADMGSNAIRSVHRG